MGNYYDSEFVFHIDVDFMKLDFKNYWNSS